MYDVGEGLCMSSVTLSHLGERPYTLLPCESRLLCPLQECGDYVCDSP